MIITIFLFFCVILFKSKICALPDPIPFLEPCHLLDLNDDCLLHILQMLPVEDLISLRLTHFRFKPLLQIVAKKENKTCIVDSETLCLHPLATSMDRYGALGEITTALVFLQVDEKVVTTLLPLFINIVALELSVPRLKNIQAIKTFPIPELLYLSVQNVRKSYLDALLIRFAPRLKGLESETTPKADFGVLQNLKSLVIDGVWLRKKSQFWKTNKTLVKLVISNQQNEENQSALDEIFDVVSNNLKDIAQMENLRELMWLKIGWRNLRPKMIPQFNHVTWVRLDMADQYVILAAINGFGSQLKTLIIENKVSTVDELIFLGIIMLISRKFPQLETLFVIIKFRCQQEHIRQLYALTNLRDCLFDLYPTPEFTLEMVKAWPKLSKLSCPKDHIGSPQLITYLKNEKRHMVINNSK